MTGLAKSFTLTLLGECGDRSQIALLAMIADRIPTTYILVGTHSAPSSYRPCSTHPPREPCRPHDLQRHRLLRRAPARHAHLRDDRLHRRSPPLLRLCRPVGLGRRALKPPRQPGRNPLTNVNIIRRRRPTASVQLRFSVPLALSAVAGPVRLRGRRRPARAQCSLTVRAIDDQDGCVPPWVYEPGVGEARARTSVSRRAVCVCVCGRWSLTRVGSIFASCRTMCCRGCARTAAGGRSTTFAPADCASI